MTDTYVSQSTIFILQNLYQIKHQFCYFGYKKKESSLQFEFWIAKHLDI